MDSVKRNRTRKETKMLSLRVSKDLVLPLHPSHETLARSVQWKEVPIQDHVKTLIELLAMFADALSDYQDQIANEGILTTDRRQSIRHGLLKNLHQVLNRVNTLEERLSRLVIEKKK